MRKLRWGLLLVLLSGCAALAHELLWTRRLIDLLGGSHDSIARVFGCFFLGLSVGAAVSTRFARQPRRCWLIACFIELGIAAASIPALTLPAWSQWIWPQLGPDILLGWSGQSVKLLLSVLVVLPPAVLMGMSLPVIAAATLGNDRTLSRQGIWLYAINTAGGVIGLTLTAGIGLELLGVSGAMSWALALNLIVALLCFRMHQRQDSTDLQATDAARPAPTQQAFSRQQRDSATDPSGMGLRLALSFISGCGILAAEILTIQLALNVVPDCIYTTTAVLAAVILTLAISAWLVPWMVTPHRPAQQILPVALALGGLLTLLTPFIFYYATDGLVQVPVASSVMGFLIKLAGYVLLSLGPGLLVSGLVLPIVFVWHGTAGNDPYGVQWGWLLAANGVGGLVGAEAANRILMPMLGMHQGLAAVALLYAVVATCLYSISRRDRSTWLARTGYAATVVLVLVGFVMAGRLPIMSEGQGFRVVEARCGPEGVVAVVDQIGSEQSLTWRRAIVQSNQFRLGSLGGGHSQRRKMLLPLLLHSQPRHVATIGLATGITAGAALDYEPVESIVAVEISPLVAVAAARHFADANRHICTDSRSQVFVEDGRTFIAATTEAFDVVVGDLFRPWVSGVGRLYSREHFAAVHGSLRPGGMFCQWLPMYQMDKYQFEIVLATFQQVFPRTFFIRGSFNASEPSLGLIGFRDGEIDWAGIEERCQQLRDRGLIRDPVLRHAEGIGMQYLGSYDGDANSFDQINTLDNALIEIDAGRRRIVASAGVRYLEWASWIAFESELRDRVHFASNEPSGIQRWATLGQKICQLHLALRQHSPAAIQLRTEVDEGLPATMIDDTDADWSAFPLRLQ